MTPRALFAARMAATAFAVTLVACAAPPAQAPRTTGFTLESPGRADNELLPARYAGNNKANPNCDGENVSLPLAWSRAPAGTRSFAIVMDDQAGRAGLGVNHWVAYGIAPAVTGFAEGETSVPSARLVAGRNTGGTTLSTGPCPPRGNAPQHYVFTLIATTLAPDALAAGLTKPELLEALKGQTLGAASLVQRYVH